MEIPRDNAAVLIPLELAGCMLHFKHHIPTSDEIESLKQYCLTQDEIP
jgi:hypothetical protein